MAYTAPTISSTGLTIPTYSDILEELINETKTIYGQDIYLETDSMDYQFLSIFAAKSYDIMQLLQLVYNNRSPGTAVGSALDSIVKINGISRKSESYSTCSVTITGTASTKVNNGVVQDITGYRWGLPASVTIGTSGTITVTATCQVTGPVTASPGDINTIVTPTYGWNAVTNATSATLGANTETDAALRARQALSVSATSLTVLDSLTSTIAALESVTRYKVYENDTGEVDTNGLEPHSIAAVVEGGSSTDIARAIFSKKAPGVYTSGTTTVTLTDNYGNSNYIRFYRPVKANLDITVGIKKLTGYTDLTAAEVKAKLMNHLNSLTIGDDVTISSLWGAALSAMESLVNPSFSITSLTAARHEEVQGTTDINIAFNEVVQGVESYITVNEL